MYDLDILTEVLKYNPDTKAIKTKLWPKVKQAMDKPATKSAYKRVINDFISARSQDLYDALPCSRILCSEKEMDRIFDVLKISKKEVTDIINETYYGPIDNFNPLAAKHEFTVTQLLIIKYFIEEKQKKDRYPCISYRFNSSYNTSLSY